MTNGLRRILEYYKAHKGQSAAEIARALGMKPDSLRRQMLWLLHAGAISQDEYTKLFRGLSRTDTTSAHRARGSQQDIAKNAKESINFDCRGETAHVESRSSRIQTLEDLLRAANVDTTIWEVERYIINKWEVGAIIDGEAVVEPLWQVKATLRRRAEAIELLKLKQEILQEIRAAAPKLPPIKHRPGEHMLELSLADVHMGRLTWHETVDGVSWDVERAAQRYLLACKMLLKKAEHEHLDRILFPVGNDFLNSDNAAGETHAGTRVMEDSRYQRTWRIARDTVIAALLMAREVAPVDVIIVPGNHDKERIFYFGDVLAAYFHNDKRIRVDNTPPLRKYVKFGVNLIGFTHGSYEAKITDLPLIMATERPEWWAQTKYREWHLGHFHRKREIRFLDVDEMRGVRIRILPSLTAVDDWHYERGYNWQHTAEAYLWNAKTGYCGHWAVNAEELSL